MRRGFGFSFYSGGVGLGGVFFLDFLGFWVRCFRKAFSRSSSRILLVFVCAWKCWLQKGHWTSLVRRAAGMGKERWQKAQGISIRFFIVGRIPLFLSGWGSELRLFL